jgi:hypothetical protein
MNGSQAINEKLIFWSFQNFEGLCSARKLPKEVLYHHAKFFRNYCKSVKIYKKETTELTLPCINLKLTYIFFLFENECLKHLRVEYIRN